MYINAPILLHHLDPYFSFSFWKIQDKNYVRTPVYYNNFFQMDRHIVLVGEQDLSRCLTQVSNSVVICTEKGEEITSSGDDIERNSSINSCTKLPDAHLSVLQAEAPESLGHAGSNDLIILKDPMAESMTFHILTYILDRFSDWESQLQSILQGSRSFHDMVNTISDMMELPVALTDQDFRYIAFSDNSAPHMSLVDPQNRIPLELISKWTSDPAFQALEKKRHAFLYHAEGTPPVVYRNIFYRNHYIGRLACILPEKELTEEKVLYHKSIFDLAAEFVELLYSQAESFENTSLEYQDIHSDLMQILRGDLTKLAVLAQHLTDFGSLPDDQYLMLTFMPQGAQHAMYSPAYFSSQLEYSFPGCFCVWMQDVFIALVNQDHYRRSGDHTLLTELLDFSRTSRMYCGLSRSFRNIADPAALQAAVQQARYAVQRGRAAGRLASRFDRYALDFALREGATSLPRNQICHPALLLLSDYDKKHGTQFITTLKAFVDQRYKASNAAKALFIHRSSFLGRMERISELVFINFDSPKERLYLELSLYAFFGEDE